MTEMQQHVGKQHATLKTLKAGSPDYSKIEVQLAKRIADFRVDEALKKKRILAKEATIYYHTYQGIGATVAAICQRHRINLVLRYDSRQMDPLNRNSVLAAVNRDVVFQSNIDITQDVVREINLRTARNN